MTGSASTVIGQKPIKDKFDDSKTWTPIEPTRANERAKFIGERESWNEVLQAQNEGCFTKMTTLLPYFICGPPLYREAFNTSCDAINSVIDGNPFPEVMLPMVDVRDAASAHILPIVDPTLVANNGRHLISTESLWMSKIVQLLHYNRA